MNNTWRHCSPTHVIVMRLSLQLFKYFLHEVLYFIVNDKIGNHV